MKKTLFFAFLLTLTAGSANAQMNSGTQEHSFLGLGGGVAIPAQDYPSDVTQPAIFKVFAGRMLEEYFGIQGEVSGLIYPTGGGTVYDIRGSLLMKLVAPLKTVEPYFLLGTGGGVKIDTNVTDYSYDTFYDVFTFLLITGLGVQFEVAKGFNLYLEGQADFNIGGSYTTIDFPVMAGLSFRLN